MNRLIRVADRISESTGRVFCWVCLVLVASLCVEVISRYIFNTPQFWANDIPRMLGGTITSMGFAYTLLHKGHVRVDVIYSRLSERKKLVIDTILNLVLFFPLLIALIYKAFTTMVFAWVHGEKWVMSIWYPPAGPIYTVVFIGLCMLSFQAFAIFIRDLQSLKGQKK